MTYTDSDGTKKTRDKNAVFDFRLMKKFLEDFVFTDKDDGSSEEVGQVNTKVSQYAHGFQPGQL